MSISTCVSRSPFPTPATRRIPLWIPLCLGAALPSLLQGCAAKAPKPGSPSENLPQNSYAGNRPDTASQPRPYLFAWPFWESASIPLRGGTTQGAEVQLAGTPDSSWERIRQPGLEAKVRDRAAILAMAGDYRASFDFLETLVFTEADNARKPAAPYRSWGTERIYVLADSADFISLQHIMVMFFIDEKGKKLGPMVMKHWRQDWRYEPASITEFTGNNIWNTRETDTTERRGAWSQTVFHVDDSPRYASLGRWEHNASYSAWTGNSAWRPLPRREHSVRDDYQVLSGINRHTVQPGGWVHEQDNLKMVLDESGRPDSTLPFRAREYGVNRYDRIRDFDFSAGDAYWESTGPFWKTVREAWNNRLRSHDMLQVSDHCEEEPAFAAFFQMADESARNSGIATEGMNRLLDCIIIPIDP